MILDALSYRSWLETLVAYISFPSPVSWVGIDSSHRLSRIVRNLTELLRCSNTK
jgi:hypothetical protein